MRQIAILAMVTMMALPFGCTKVKSIADINVDIPNNTQVTVPEVSGYPGGVSIPGGLAINFPTVGAETQSQYYMDKYHTSASMVRSVDLKSLYIQILSPASQNFDFLDTVQLYMSTRERQEILVAYKYDIPKGTNQLDFVIVPGVNLKDYFLADSIFMRMRTHLNATPASGTQLNIVSDFHMLANPLY